jgi:superfamily II DNA or RNA helicase
MMTEQHATTDTQTASQLIVQLHFLFDTNDRLFLAINLLYNDEPISLSLASFMQFLYKNDAVLSHDDSEFCYVLTKLVKKVDFQGDLLYAIPNDYDMALLMRHANAHHIKLQWKQNDAYLTVDFDHPLPLTIEVTKHGHKLHCRLVEHSLWQNDPLHWLVLTEQQSTYCFCNGVVKQLDTDFLNFMDRFLDRDTIIFTQDEAVLFIKQLYQSHKSSLFWSIHADFMAFIPQDIPPEPVLKLTYKEPMLIPTLRFLYDKENIASDFDEETIINKSNGKTMNRLMDMEGIYQQDLMTLFTEFKLPFMLQNPGDIAKFLDKLVPILKDRGWVIDSDVPDFNVSETPVDLSFNMTSSDNNLFYFEPNCDINGHTHSLQEIASLMVQNQGYIKTKKGFVQLSDQSQHELKTLASLNAFRTGKTFSKSEVLPLVTAAKVQGTSSDVRTLIERIDTMRSLSKFHVSDSFKGQLRDYQQFGVNWMFMLSQMGLGGVLADDMGLGKTVQTIALSTRLPGKVPILVVGPTNVIYNWSKEIDTFLPGKSVVIYSGPNRHTKQDQFQSADFIITSFGVLKNDINVLSKTHYKAIFIDEAQYIKNPKTQISQAVKCLHGDFKLVMTGTPIENQLQDLWNLFDFVMPDYLGTQKAFDTDIIESRRTIIKTKIKPFVLRREKREVLDALPEKTEIIIKCPLSEEQMALYRTVLDATKKGILSSTGKRNRLGILAALLKLRQVCIHPGLLKEVSSHAIPSAKFELVKEKIIELMEENHKVVMFSQFTGMLDIIQGWVNEQQFYLERIDGKITGKSRQAAIDRFQSKKGAGIFLISLKAGGVGINLTAADYVMHLDPWWNPAIESQATDRVHRMGQKNKVFVYKFIAEGTIEEKIQDLQGQKKQLLAQIIDIDSAEEKAINLDEIKSLILG